MRVAPAGQCCTEPRQASLLLAGSLLRAELDLASSGPSARSGSQPRHLAAAVTAQSADGCGGVSVYQCIDCATIPDALVWMELRVKQITLLKRQLTRALNSATSRVPLRWTLQ